MTSALKSRILLFNVVSESELVVLAECAARARERSRIALRVNPYVPANTHPYISTGLQQHKFGVPIDEARKLYAQASGSGYLQIAGVSVHIGSQITDVDPFAAAMNRVAELVRALRRDGHRIEYVDAGGGVGIRYCLSENRDFESFAGDYAEARRGPLRGWSVSVLIQPSRSMRA